MSKIEEKIAIHGEKIETLTLEVSTLRTRTHELNTAVQNNNNRIRSLIEERKLLFENIENRMLHLSDSLDKLNRVVDDTTKTLTTIMNFKYKLIGWFAATSFIITIGMSLLLKLIK